MKAVLYSLAFVAVLSAAGGAYGGFKAGGIYQARQDEKNTRAVAVAHSCGQYNAKSGTFEWIEAAPQIDMAQLSMPEPVPKPKPKQVHHAR